MVDLTTMLVNGVGQAGDAVDLNTLPLASRLPTDRAAQFSLQFTEQVDTPAPLNVTSEMSAAKKFEAIVVAQMLTSILPKDSEFFGEGFAGDAWRSMMSEQLANVAVKQTDFGIASLIEQDLESKVALTNRTKQGAP